MERYILKRSIIAISYLVLSAECFANNTNLDIKVGKWQIECIDETKVDPLMVLKIRSGNWDDSPRKTYGIKVITHMRPPKVFRVPPFKGNIYIQKWALCILVKAGIMSPQGVFKLDAARELIPPNKREKVLDKADKCLYKRKHTPGEIAWEYLKCYNKDERKKLKIL